MKLNILTFITSILMLSNNNIGLVEGANLRAATASSGAPAAAASSTHDFEYEMTKAHRHLSEREVCDPNAEVDTCSGNTSCVQGRCRNPPGSTCSDQWDCTSLYCGNNKVCAVLSIDDKRECSSDSDCSDAGLVCGHGRCRQPAGSTCYVPYDCATLTCHSFHKTCQSLQVCEEGGSETFECPAGYQCNSRDGAFRKHCRLPAGSTCQSNDDCVTDTYCNSGTCTQIQPLQERNHDCQLPFNNGNGPNYVQAQCPSGQVCWTHSCDPGTNNCDGNCGRNRGELCTENADCANAICDIFTRRCFQ